MTVDKNVRYSFYKSVFELVAEFPDTSGNFRHFNLRAFNSFAKADNSKSVFGARAEMSFLVSAVDKSADRLFLAHIKSANAFWSIYFVSGKCKKVYPEILNIYRYFTYRLNSIRMK